VLVQEMEKVSEVEVAAASLSQAAVVGFGVVAGAVHTQPAFASGP
jgi:hypothetical protein